MEEFPVMINTLDQGGYQPIRDNREVDSENISREELALQNASQTDEPKDHMGDPNTTSFVSDNSKEHLTETHQAAASSANCGPSDDSFTNETPQSVEEAVGENDNLLLERKEDFLPREACNQGLIQAQQSDGLSGVNDLNEGAPMINGEKHGKDSNNDIDYEIDIPLGYEAVLLELGNPGRFVVVQIVLHMLTLFCLSNTALIYVFIGFEPAHTCKQLSNESELLSRYPQLNSSTYQVHYGTCDIAVISNTSGTVETVAAFDCLEGHDYKGDKHISFVAEWDIVCGNARWKELVQLILLVGQTVGGIVCTSIADKYGRRPIMVLANFLLCACGIGAAYSPNIYVLIFFRFFCGLFQQGMALVSFTLMMEFLTAKHRQVVAVLSGLCWTTSVLVLAALAYLMRDENWRHLQLAAALFACNVLLYPMFLYESPRWLIANNRHKQALAITKKACIANGKDYEKIKAVFDVNTKQLKDVTNQQGDASVKPPGSEVERYSLVDIARHRSLLILVLFMCFIWVTNSTTYYGLFFTSSSLAGDRHLNFFLMGLADMPADLINLVLFSYFGRKPVIMSWLVVAGSSLLTATMLMAFGTTGLTNIFTTVFSFVSKLGIGASFNGIYMYTPELFPTNLRSAGMGICSGVSRIGGMLAPYAHVLAQLIVWGPGILFSAMCFISAIMFIKLPETRGRPMPNTISEMKQRATHQSKYKASPDHAQQEQSLPLKDVTAEV